MDSLQLLVEGFGRIRGAVHRAVDSLSAAQLGVRLDAEANSVAWLVWHLTRIQDDHIADVAGAEQRWTAKGWVSRFGLPFDASDTGYGHRPEDVAAVRVKSGELLTAYYDEVHEQTIRFVSGLREDELDTVVDESWTPPVTLAVRLVSVLADDLEHAGQAAFVRGIVLRR